MLIPDNILHTLLCHKCEKYLNIPPIKVYPNRSITCGRCNKDDDDGVGVVSSYYKLLVRQFYFPCINRYEGCTQILACDEVEKHEKNCVAKKYDCPFCVEFKSTAYYLQLHLKQYHSANRLTCEEFIVDFDRGDLHKTFWYNKDNLLILVFCFYDSFEKKLFLDIGILGNDKHMMHYKCLLNTLENQTVQRSISYSCDKVMFEINPKLFSKFVAVCKFEVTGSVLETRLINEITTVNPDLNNVPSGISSFIYKIPDVRNLECDKWILLNNSISLVENISWNLSFYKHTSHEAFFVGLVVDKNENEAIEYIIIQSALIYKYPNVIKPYSNELDMPRTVSHGMNVFTIAYTKLFDEANDYLEKDGSFKIKFDIAYKFKKPFCKTCKICDACKQSGCVSHTCKTSKNK